MGTDDRTEADALLPAEREMSAKAWSEYVGLPTTLRGYCHLLMRREAEARLRERTAELEVAEWRERTARLLARAEAAEQRAEAAEQRAEAAEIALAQAHADRALLTGLWLAAVPLEVLPALLPADPGDRDRLAAALDAVDLQSGTESHTAAVRAVIGRIVAETAGGAR